MANEKLFTAREAAQAVLNKARELLQNSDILKKSEPFEKKKEQNVTPPDGVQTQKAPEANPKEQAEGNNELAGTTPTQVGQDGKNLPGFDEMIGGHLKLAKFIGHMQAKRKMRNPSNG